MIESPVWNPRRDESVYKAAGVAQLAKYGHFFEKLSETYWKNVSSLEYVIEGPIRVFYRPVENISILSLVETENKVFSKIFAAIVGTCREIRILKSESGKFYRKLFVQGENNLNDNNGKIECLLSDLQDLSTYVNRISTVIYLTVQQLAALAGNSHEIYLPPLMEHLLDLFMILITLDEIIDSQPSILSRWKKFRIQIRSVVHNSVQSSVSLSRLETFENLLKDLHNELLSKNLFSRAIERSMGITKNSVMADHFINYLRNTVTDIETKKSENHSYSKNWARINVGMVFISKLFSANDKKLIKRIHEINKRFYALTLIANVIWLPNTFLKENLPKDLVNTVGLEVGEKLLAMKIQRLQAVESSLIHRAILWSAEVQSASSNNQLQILPIERQSFLLNEILIIIESIRDNVHFLTNLHAALSKPMTRSTVQQICRLIEVQKCLETTFHTLGPVIVQSQYKILQQTSYQILKILESVRKGLTQKDKGYRKERLDALCLIGLSMRLIGGPGTTNRRLIVRCALSCASQITDSFKEEEIVKLRLYLDNYDTIAELYDRISEMCDYSVLLHHKSMIPAFLSSALEDTSNISHVVNLLEAFNTTVSLQEESSESSERKLSEQRQILLKSILEPACTREIETNLRLDVHTHFKPNSNNPFKIGTKDSNRIVRSSPFPLGSNMISLKRFIEHYLDETFYNLTTVTLHDWKTYGTMHALAKYKLGLDTVKNNLPTQTLEQGLDALEIMRNINVFVSKYLYDLHTQTFIEHNSSSKYLNTIGIRHIANSIRTHGTGIMSTTVNCVYQFLRIKLNTLSQFLFDEHIKSRLMRDIRFVKAQRENGTTVYTYERAEKFQKAIRKLGITANNLSYLDQFRQLITHIGNALGYIRLIRSGGLHASSNAVSFLPDINSRFSFEEISKELNYSRTSKMAAKRLEDDIANLITNFTEGIQYFKLLVDVFSSAFRDSKSHHLQQFYAIVPPLTLSFVDNAVANKEKLFKKDKTGAAFTDDGFAMGIAYINALLDQSDELDGLQWFETVNRHIENERLVAESSKTDHVDEKLEQTKALTLKRLNERSAEFRLLYYSLSGARVFFKSPDL